MHTWIEQLCSHGIIDPPFHINDCDNSSEELDISDPFSRLQINIPRHNDLVKDAIFLLEVIMDLRTLIAEDQHSIAGLLDDLRSEHDALACNEALGEAPLIHDRSARPPLRRRNAQRCCSSSSLCFDTSLRKLDNEGFSSIKKSESSLLSPFQLREQDAQSHTQAQSSMILLDKNTEPCDTWNLTSSTPAPSRVGSFSLSLAHRPSNISDTGTECTAVDDTPESADSPESMLLEIPTTCSFRSMDWVSNATQTVVNHECKNARLPFSKYIEDVFGEVNATAVGQTEIKGPLRSHSSRCDLTGLSSGIEPARAAACRAGRTTAHTRVASMPAPASNTPRRFDQRSNPCFTLPPSSAQRASLRLQKAAAYGP